MIWREAGESECRLPNNDGPGPAVVLDDAANIIFRFMYFPVIKGNPVFQLKAVRFTR